jgi:hypothetical protein
MLTAAPQLLPLPPAPITFPRVGVVSGFLLLPAVGSFTLVLCAATQSMRPFHLQSTCNVWLGSSLPAVASGEGLAHLYQLPLCAPLLTCRRVAANKV